MVQLYESCNTGDDDGWAVYGVNWNAMTFTTTSGAHTIQQVKIKAMRTGSPGTVTVSIRATSGGKPTGSDLTSGTIDGNTFTTNSGGDWYTITVADYALAASTLYAIVVRATAGNGSNYMRWRGDTGGGLYTTGNACDSGDSGVNWTTQTYDSMFEDWGIPPGVSKSLAATMSLAIVRTATLITPKGVEKLIYIPDLGVFGIELD